MRRRDREGEGGGARRLCRIALALLVGVVLSVAIAWLRVPAVLDYTDMATGADGSWTRAGWAHIKMHGGSERYSPPPRWAAVPRSKAEHTCTEVAGWPFWCMRGAGHYKINRGNFYTGQVYGHHPPEQFLTVDIGNIRRHHLPLWPMPLGLLANTLLYGSVAYGLLFAAPGLVQRVIRQRRGRCFRCGYDLRDTPEGPCPECGRCREAAA